MHRSGDPCPDGVKILFERAVFCSMITAITKAFTRKASLIHFDLSACMNSIKNTEDFLGEAARYAQPKAPDFLALVKLLDAIVNSCREVFSLATALFCQEN